MYFPHRIGTAVVAQQVPSGFLLKAACSDSIRISPEEKSRLGIYKHGELVKTDTEMRGIGRRFSPIIVDSWVQL